jgi:site-specific DNA recombinase
MALTFAGLMDEQFLAGHRDKIRRGQEGQVKRGYNPGGKCYGYQNIADEDPNRRGLHGRADVKGCRQVIDPEQAVVVRLIFKMYADGNSYARIAKYLNAQNILPPQQPRKKGIRSWCPSAIREMLLNERAQ